ncbi:hypothetical protein [Streptomyces bottropensis]|uniref:Uncharacterized protein n=1 Tax=Streptomyces bottropensis ATCC 25435 TaxID=1054862 RepID=M3FYN5_9ACTN|nr:hypothetical protein [Streptomyces bottropensis]EMF57394.1 hypothetical protein SBD_0066 [Streptomyces bottropensis ATCC 25435]MZD17966.1 hypothetical protein [Streptomyces sp. SID5476]
MDLLPPSGGNDEHLGLSEPGAYELYVVQYALPNGVTSQPYTLHTWLTGKDTRRTGRPPRPCPSSG